MIHGCRVRLGGNALSLRVEFLCRECDVAIIYDGPFEYGVAFPITCSACGDTRQYKMVKEEINELRVA
jgi:hypothetical protein